MAEYWSAISAAVTGWKLFSVEPQATVQAVIFALTFAFNGSGLAEVRVLVFRQP